MSLLLHEVLDESAKAHLRRLLQAGPEAGGLRDRVSAFVETQVRVAREAEQAFRALPSRERERLLSELAWRVTCHLDGSVTRVLGVHTLVLGYGFAAVVSEQAGRDVFVLVEDL